MQFQVCESDDSCQPGAQYTNPRVVVEEHHGAPLLNCSGLVLVRQLIERLGVARAIDAGVRVLQRCKWYRESDHILTLIYSMISGGSRLQDVNRLGQDDALKRVLGSDRIPHATTIGKFLWRFGDDQQDKQRQGLAELRDTTAAVQQEAFGMLPRERRKVATLDWDSSIHEVYGQKKEGADFAYDNTWSYDVEWPDGRRTLLRGVAARQTLQLTHWARPGPYTHRLAGGESSLLHDRGTGLELEDVDVESAAPRGWRGDAFPALSVSVDLASRNGREERPQYRRAEAAGG